MVRIYATNVSGLPDPMSVPEILEGLANERIQKILRYKQAQDRVQSLGASLLLKTVLLRCGFQMADIRYGENGKPMIEGIHFNISHSVNMAICAVSSERVGCDIEKVTKYREGIAERFFCKREVEYLNSLDGQQKTEAFYRIWTMKESYMKMTGEGMKLPLDQFEFELEKPVKVIRDGCICSCNIKEYEVPEYRVTVCAEEMEFAEKIEYVEA